MFALIDCNNFYASCERVFQPHLNEKPIVILSNNDGCVIARSNEAKDLGIKIKFSYVVVAAQGYKKVKSADIAKISDDKEQLGTIENIKCEWNQRKR